MNSDTSVCSDQQTFNNAVRTALDSEAMYNAKRFKWANFVYLIVWLLFLVWALTLINKTFLPLEQRVEHTFFALIAPPLYVLAFYAGKM